VAVKSASQISPTEDELRDIDNPAPEHQWHDAPDLSRENIKNKIRQQFDQNKPVSGDDVRETVGNATQTADPHGSRDPSDTIGKTADDQRYGTASGIDSSRGIRSGVEELRQRADENLPEEQKQRMRRFRERTTDYMRGKMPQERREQVIFRLKKMIVEIQSHEDYQQAVETLLRLAETYTGHGKGLAKGSTGTVKGARQDSHLQSAEKSLKVS
jgi:hypothetical protein